MKSQTKFNLFLIAFFGCLSCSYAQMIRTDTSYWSSGGFGSLTFSQVTLQNWAAGGQSSLAINAATNLFADYKRDRTTWENTLDLGYGLIRQGKKEEGAELVKSDDIINLVTKYGYQISRDNDSWYLSGLLNFRTQFTRGYQTAAQDTVISRFLAPGYLMAGIGVDYKPNEVLSINYTPLAAKFTFVTDEQLSAKGAYGVDPGSEFRAEFGSYLRLKYQDEIFRNVTLNSRLELFSNYLENFGVIDVNWQNGLVMKINDVLSATFTTHLIYDKDINIAYEDENGNTVVGPRVQFKSVFGAGLAYSLGATRTTK